MALTFKNAKEMLANAEVLAAVGKAVARATKAETARCVAAVKAVELAEGDRAGRKVLSLAAAAVKAVI